MNKKKVIIIGGGVSGLSCGIYCQKYGFDTVILEKTAQMGGNLTGWFRNNCYIDNCIHWLNGSSEESDLNKKWKEIGAITNETKFHQSEYFYVSEHKGKTVGLGIDIEETERQMIDMCPEDYKQIKKFFNAVKYYIRLINCKASIKKIALVIKLFGMYGKKTLFQIAKSCKTKLMQKFFTDYILGEYSIYVLILAYGAFVSKDGKVLKTGSLKMSNNILQNYIKMGGQARVKNCVKNVNVKNGKIESVETEDGLIYIADYFVFACDPTITFKKLLLCRMPKELQKTYNDRVNYPIISSFHVAYDVSLEKIDIPDSFVFDCDPIVIGKTIYTRLMVRNYDYGINYAPKGHLVLQIFLLQREQDFDYFKSLNKEDYKKEKNIISKKITLALTKRFPNLEEKIKIIDCWTPLTYSRYFNAYKGSYMSFGITKKIRLKSVPFKIANLKNAFIATQWQTLFGGLPNALMQGNKCAMEIFKTENFEKNCNF